MKRLMTNTGAKAGAVLILTLCVLLFISSIAGTVYLYGTNAVDKKGLRYYETDLFQYNLSDSAFQYMGYYYYNSDAGKKEMEESAKGGDSAAGDQVSGNTSDTYDDSLYPIVEWQAVQGDMVAEIPKWSDMEAGSYRIKVGEYFYRVESTADGKKQFINEDGSTAFLLYQSTEGDENTKYIGYISGEVINANGSLLNYSSRELDDYMMDEVVWLNPKEGRLYFNRQREIVWIGRDVSESGTETAQFMLSLDSVIYADESREEDGHMNYMASVAQSHSAGDFENMNIHMAIYSKSDGSADPVQTGGNSAAEGSDTDGTGAQKTSDTPLTTDSVLARYMTKDLLSFSTKISAESVSSTEGAADVSGLGSKVSENYSYSGKTDYSVTIGYDNGMSIVCSVTEPMKNIDIFLLIKLFHNIFTPFGAWIILADVILGFLCAALFVFLMMAAGRRTCDGRDPEDDDPQTANRGVNGDGRDFWEKGEGFEQSAEAGTAGNDNGSGAGRMPAGGEAAVRPKAAGAKMRSQRRLLKAEQKAAWRSSQGYCITASAADRIPFDLFLLIFFILFGGAMAVDIASAESALIAPWGNPPGSQTYPIFCAAAAAAVVQILLCILFSMSCAVRFKLGGWWRNSLIWRILVWMAGILGKAGEKIFGPLWRGIREAVGNIAVQWKLGAVFVLVVMVNLFAGSQLGWYGSGFLVFLGILFDIAVFLVVMAVGVMLRRLQKGGRALANGDLNAKVDTSNMRGEFREHGENLNNISRGMAIAIEQRMKSERMKTELITNVSHDIKTPLTSIVNYVDLLSKEDLEGKAAEYTEVLVRQSARLKKLTEDLVEASKASTGNITVSLQRINICETVNQAVGEYAERLQAASLSAVTDFPDHPVIAEADGRLLWRILDNLLSNVCKYSMPGTRVYITVTELRTEAFTADSSANSRKAMSSYTDGNPAGIFGENGLKKYFGKKRLHRNRLENNTDLQDSQRYDTENDTADAVGYSALPGRVSIAVKNISRERLNVATDELMERFVRGDSARTTEGSGLGLNIARSLTELQGGRFGLSIDGDLFKAEIILRSE